MQAAKPITLPQEPHVTSPCCLLAIALQTHSTRDPGPIRSHGFCPSQAIPFPTGFLHQRGKFANQGMQSTRNPASRSGCGPMPAAEESAILLLRSHSNIHGESLFPALIGSNCSSQINRSGNCFAPIANVFQHTNRLFTVFDTWKLEPVARTWFQFCLRDTGPPGQRYKRIGNSLVLCRRRCRLAHQGQSIVTRVRKVLR